MHPTYTEASILFIQLIQLPLDCQRSSQSGLRWMQQFPAPAFALCSASQEFSL